ncbi:prosaposin isoform X2 [Sphaerodactylus townsendi]|uniref:prosaposin isoform X2 n=1 Tax=Sphaerodactylus townsendi TaxID=933632 RepID=UPI0020269C75|nr:prosaposin isoform X2 [Sphaerodactylus townsendi]
MARLAGFLLLLGCFAAALANPIVFQKDCARGAEVWCENLKTASHCNAVKHCQQNVWSKPTVETIPCELCKEIVVVAGKFLKNNDTEDEIHGYMSKVCEFLPDEGLVSECKEMVDAYLPNILDMIKGELDKPEVVCSSLTLCQSLQKHLASVKLQKQLQSNKIPELDFSELASPFMANVPLLLYPQDKPKEESREKGNVCQDCIQLMTDIQGAVKSNSTFVHQLIQNALEQCEHLGPAMADQCKDYISQYSDLAIQLFAQMSPQMLCSMAGLCSAVKSVPLQTLVPAKAIHEVKAELLKNSVSQAESLTLCDACEIMVEEVTSLLESNRSEEEMVHAMDAVCAMLPEKGKEECQSFVEVYGKAVIDMLLEATNPKLVCVMLKCCTDKAVPAEIIVPVQSQNGDVCDVCKVVIAYVDKQLQKNATTAEIEAALERVCNLLPASYRDQCDQFVEQYEPMAVQLLAEMMDPGFVCSKLGACGVSTHPLLGSEKCVWGPGYWCKNLETAAKCNAVEHCKRHVWN